MEHRRVSRVWFGIACAVWLVTAGCSRNELEPTPAEVERPAVVRPPAPVFQAVPGVQSLQQTTLMTYPLPHLKSHLDIRTTLVRAGEPVVLNVEHDGVFELRTGSLTLIVDDKPTSLARGYMWQVAKGSKVTLQAKGELAVVRAVYVVPGEK